MHTADDPVKRPVWKGQEIVGHVSISLRDKDFLNGLGEGFYLGFTKEEHGLIQNGSETELAAAGLIGGPEKSGNGPDREENDWIYCGDGQNLPKEDGFYLVSLSDEISHGDEYLAVKKCWFNEKTGSFCDYGKFVMAWQPVPKRYVRKL